MTEHELLRIIAFLERVRQPFQELVPIAEEDATWNLLLFLVKNHLTGTPVAISTLASVAKAPHATAMRRIHALIERGDILQEPLGEGSKRFKLRPSEALLESFIQYARKIKFLLAETFGLRSKVDSDEDFYFGGSYFAAQIIPPPRLIESLFRGKQRDPVPAQRRQLLPLDAQHVGGLPQQHGLAQELRSAQIAAVARAGWSRTPEWRFRNTTSSRSTRPGSARR